MGRPDHLDQVSDPAGQQVRAGNLVTYTITLINTGALDVTATAIDSLPATIPSTTKVISSRRLQAP